MRGNTISIKGTLTRDAELKSTSGGSIIAMFSLVWNQSRKNQQGDWEDQPHYFDCKCWLTERQAAFIEGKLVKGAQVAITDGHIVQERWQDQSGNNRSRVNIMVDDPINGLLVVPRDQRPSVGQQVADNIGSVTEQVGLYDEDIPF